jgi:NAD(P)-dependent dehydrogenase (short-subunit alcohol dehydrogenase family)
LDLGLNNKTAIVTGGSGMIGQSLVLEFAREGMNVISASRDLAIGETLVRKAEKQQLAGNILPVATDVTKRVSVDAMVEQCHQAFGPVDVLVNNAGGTSRPIAFEQLGEQSRDWEKAVNIDGVVNCCQAVAEDMLGRGTGSIINISSNSSLVGEAAINLVHYGAAKGFVNSFSKSLAYEWAKKGVRVNTICPAWIVPENDETLGDGSFWNKYGFFLMGRPDEIHSSFEAGTLDKMSGLPMPRLGRAEDIAHLSLFLASDKASYITGQLISVSGGAYMP